MSETDMIPEGNKTKPCILGILSFILALISVAGIIGFCVVPDKMCAHAPLVFASLLLSLIFGLVSSSRIRKSGGGLKGQVFARTGCLISAGLVAFGFFLGLSTPYIKSFLYKHGIPYRVICGTNLRDLGKAMQQYANDYNRRYPTADRWCDLLLEHANVGKRTFLCRTAEPPTIYKTSDPNEEPNIGVRVEFLGKYDDANEGYSYVYSAYWSHYAVNPNCGPNSAADVALLFETEGGWNQFGGAEILTFENHEGKGCNVLYNGGDVEFVAPEEMTKLKWKADENKGESTE
ncbi:MAG: hypothetical protein JSV99_02580 [Planctomycetota bacterium]|nr:MAG: hypothetical protein JSV99_02580 [Planctomycetota bacterium]